MNKIESDGVRLVDPNANPSPHMHQIVGGVRGLNQWPYYPLYLPPLTLGLEFV